MTDNLLNATILQAAQRSVSSTRVVSTDATRAAIHHSIIGAAMAVEADAVSRQPSTAAPFDAALIAALLGVSVSPERLVELLDDHYRAELDDGESLAMYACLDPKKAAATLIGAASQTIWTTHALRQRYCELEAAARATRNVEKLKAIANKVAALEVSNYAFALWVSKGGEHD